jgi:hypothetical protein
VALVSPEKTQLFFVVFIQPIGGLTAGVTETEYPVTCVPKLFIGLSQETTAEVTPGFTVTEVGGSGTTVGAIVVVVVVVVVGVVVVVVVGVVVVVVVGAVVVVGVVAVVVVQVPTKEYCCAAPVDNSCVVNTIFPDDHVAL